MNLNGDEIMAVIDDYREEIRASIVRCGDRANEAVRKEDIAAYVKLKEEEAYAGRDLMVLESLRERILHAESRKETARTLRMIPYTGIRKAEVVDFFGTVDERDEY